MKDLSPAERLDWLRLTRSDNVGPVTFNLLMRRYGSAAAALDALPGLAAQGGKRGVRICTAAAAEKETEQAQKYGARLIAACEPDYPTLLKQTEDHPPLITTFGHANLLNKDSVAIVGARNASLNGKKLAEKIAIGLGQSGITITSGLARGIDTAAHQASLATGTIAVVAGGIDNVYPEENRELYKKLGETGCIVAEMPFGAEPRAQHFPRRNRIISGLSLGTVVIEAARQSGSLITARLAGEQGRDVFAVPGSPLDPRAEGSNHLLKQGAILAESADDILQHIQGKPTRFSEPANDAIEAPLAAVTESELAAAREIILENLSPSPVAVDEIVRQCHLSPPVVLTVLLELELAGRIQWQPGQRVALIGEMNAWPLTG